MTIICLDKGHKGKLPSQDCGCVGNGLYESDLTEIIGNGIFNHLKSNYEVDVRIAPRGTLTDRTNYANSINADYFLSVHINASTNTTTAYGFESFIHNNASQKSLDIQNILHTEIMKYMKQYNVFDRGKKRANFAVLRNSNMPACLIENLFISHVNDAKLLKDDKFIDGLAKSISNGLALGLGLKKKVVDKKEDKEDNTNINILNTKDSVKVKVNDIDAYVENYIINDHIYFSVKDFCNMFGKEYKWNGEKREISIK